MDYGWLRDPAIWKEIELEQAPESFKILAGDPAKQTFPPLEWSQDCGRGCSSSPLAYGDFTDDAVLGTIGPSGEAYLAVSHLFLEGKRTVRRLIHLSSERDGSALHFIPNSPENVGYVTGPREGPGLFSMGERSKEGILWVTYGPETGWDFKGPWHHERQFASWCNSFSLTSEPPVAFFACQNGLHMMKERGSSAVVHLEEERAAVGEGGHGMAVWALHPFDEGGQQVSRIQTWSPGGEVRTITELPGVVCGLAVGRDHIAGFRGDEPTGSELCASTVTNPRFFWLPKDSEMMEEGPILPASSMVISSLSTTQSFTAAKTRSLPSKASRTTSGRA